MSSPGREYFEGIITTRGTNDHNHEVRYLIPFEITINIEKTDKGLNGTYSIDAQPTILIPSAGIVNWPGVLAFFPSNITGISGGPIKPFIVS